MDKQEQYLQWVINDINNLVNGDMEDILLFKPEIIIIGTGESQIMPSNEIINFIHGKNAKLGMIGASDHHMSTLGACLTGVWTEELSGKAIFDAMSKRRVFAVANGKMVIWIESGDVQMGEVGKCEGNTTQIRAEVSSPVPIDAISLLQDGKYIEHKRFNEKKVTVVFDVGPLSKGEHYFLIRVQSHSS